MVSFKLSCVRYDVTAHSGCIKPSEKFSRICSPVFIVLWRKEGSVLRGPMGDVTQKRSEREKKQGRKSRIQRSHET